MGCWYHLVESGGRMGPVFVVSEWLPKEGMEEEFWGLVKEVMALTSREEGCVRAHATQQVAHPGSPGKSKYTVILLQEYTSIEMFTLHCKEPHVVDFFERYVNDPKTSIVEDWTCRLFAE